jgi:hypothetical protein
MNSNKDRIYMRRGAVNVAGRSKTPEDLDMVDAYFSVVKADKDNKKPNSYTVHCQTKYTLDASTCLFAGF